VARHGPHSAPDYRASGRSAPRIASSTGRAWSINTAAARERIADVGDRIVHALSDLRIQATELQPDQQIVDTIAQIAEGRAGQVRQLASYRPTPRKGRR